ncbi:MAG: VOC family protein [Proteobacteria bacterium]|jgi:hypothetical protein|nr:VOC family protein [Pseudomonadota bacterium]MDA1300344.1 VOC family protein [Pseudomonadota bacterium]
MITAMPRIAIAVHEFDRIVTLFREVFGMPVIDISETSVPHLGARLAMCVPSGGSNIELMGPARPDAPLSQSLQRFLERRGEGLFALMLEAPVPDEEAVVLLENGLNVLPLMEGAGGRDIHPRSTHGVLIRVYPENSFQGEAEPPDDALQISGIMRVIIAVNDLAKAIKTYSTGIGLEADDVRIDPRRGVETALIHPPNGGIIELVSPNDNGKRFSAAVDAFLNEKGEGMYALVLQASDLDHVAGILMQRGLHVSMNDDGLDVNQDDTFGALIRIEHS